jgi:hypothetical protein
MGCVADHAAIRRRAESALASGLPAGHKLWKAWAVDLADDALADPAVSAPEYLAGEDGDVAFVRRDLGETPTLASEWALGQGVNLSQLEADPVEMLPVPEHFTDIEYEWAVVRGGTPGAVAYWRFRA